jgi:AcrR family transcriptional regulator
VATDRHEQQGRRGWLGPDAIVDAALLIVDREGFDALSMRRIAQELGVGTMSLYHHVADRDALIDRMADAVTGEMLVPDAVLDDWRAGLSAIAHATRGMFLRHPWVLQGFHHGRPPTPSLVRHIEQSMRVARALPVDDDTRRAILMAVDDLAVGTAVREAGRRAGAGSGAPPSEFERSLAWMLDGIQAMLDGR